MNANETTTRAQAEFAEKLAERAEKANDGTTARRYWNVAAGLWREIGWGPAAAKCEGRAICAN